MTAPQRVCLLFAAAWLLAAPGGKASETSQGDVSCPCTNVSTHLQNCSLSRGGHCFDEGYGSATCQAHTAGLAECNVATPPTHCGKRWCFVDFELCRRSTHDLHGIKLPDPSNMYVHYSYSTCGEDGKYDGDRLIEDMVSGKPIVAAVPCMIYPTHYKLDANGEIVEGVGELYRNDSHPWAGSMIDYFNKIASIGNMDVRYTWVSDGAREIDVQYWTSAVRTIGQGVADIGISDFFFTAARAAMSPFTVPLGRDIIWLWVPRPMQDTRIKTMMMKPLKPFSAGVWLALLAIACVSVLLEYLWSPARKRVAAAAGTDNSFVENISGSLHDLGQHSLKHSQVLGEASGKRSKAQRILRDGWICVTFTLSASYTANLASILMETDVGEYIKSLDEAVEQGVTICGMDAVQEEMIIRFPPVKPLLKEISYSRPLYDQYFEQGCEVMLYSWQEASRMPAVLKALCELNLVPVEEVTSFVVSWPVRESLLPSMSYWMQYMYKETGGEYYRDYESHFGSMRCEADGRDVTSLSVETDEQLHSWHFLLPFAVWGATVLAGSVAYLAPKVAVWRASRGSDVKSPDASSADKGASRGSDVESPDASSADEGASSAGQKAIEEQDAVERAVELLRGDLLGAVERLREEPSCSACAAQGIRLRPRPPQTPAGDEGQVVTVELSSV